MVLVRERTAAPRGARTSKVPLTAEQRARLRRIGLAAVALAILALCVFLHLFRLADAPGWDPQEGYNLDIAGNLAQGQLRLFALRSAFAQHPPLFYLQVVAAIRIFGYGVIAVRAVATLYAILTCGALLAVGRRIVGTGPALWGALAYTVTPLILANTRWGYSYAQLAFVGLLCLGATWEYRHTGQRRWLVTAAALAGLAACSDYAGAAWIIFVALTAIPRGWRPALLALTIGSGILLADIFACFVASPAIFAADFAATAGRAGGGNLLAQLVLLLVNYWHFTMLDAWLMLGIVGLFLAPARSRGFLLGAVTVLGVLVLKVREVGLSLHTVVPLLPLLALGMGVALDLGLRSLYAWCLGWLNDLLRNRPALTRWGNGRLIRLCAALTVFLAVVSPVGLALAGDAAGLASTFTTRQDAILATPADANRAAAFVRSHASAGDLVLASPNVAWMFDAPGGRTRGADILQSLAQTGSAAAFYPAGLAHSRWVYDVSLRAARYVVVDDLLRALAKPDQERGLVPVLEEVQSWRVVFVAGQYTVYERPGS